MILFVLTSICPLIAEMRAISFRPVSTDVLCLHRLLHTALVLDMDPRLSEQPASGRCMDTASLQVRWNQQRSRSNGIFHCIERDPYLPLNLFFTFNKNLKNLHSNTSQDAIPSTTGPESSTVATPQ